jgi:bifunctional DNase/RNase
MDSTANVELAYVGVFRNPKSKCPTVVLKAVTEPDNAMAIGISKETAVSILTAKGSAVCEGGPLRPSVHDAFAGLTERAGIKFERAVIYGLDDRGVFAASLFGSLPGGVSFDPIDIRASDAVALALRTGASLEVNPEVWERSEHYDVGLLPFTELEVRNLLPL